MEALKNILIEKIKAHINLKDDVKSLETKLQGLRCRKADIELQVKNAERSGAKKRKREVENWLEEVEKVENEFRALNDRVQKGGRFSNIFIRGRVAKMDARVEQLTEQSQHFGEFWLDDFENKGEPRVTTKLFGQMFSEGLKSISEWLVTDKISNIGIYGMGGVGKTTLAKHIHNYLLEKAEFNVYWITVSQEFSLKKLQDDIAKFVNLELAHIVDEETRAAKLSGALKQQQYSVLIILDDVWEGISLERIGIPLASEKCKLILTTRSLEVCRRMGCQKEFDVKTLDTNESWELFKFTLGPDCDRILTAEIKQIAKSVAKECAGLPLGIVIVAGSMTGIDDIHEWRNALEQLKACSIGHEEMERDVFPILEWSFNQLNKYQKCCFLYCSLYPEDWHMEREELVNLFIGAELLERRDTRQLEFDQGHTILNKLVRVGLLEKTTDRKGHECVKMHDLIRDMAIRITGREFVQKIKDVPRFLVKSEGAKQEEWTEDLDAVSIWDMKKEIPSGASPKCLKLSTILFRGGKIKTIPNSFFRHMAGLKVLNLMGCRYLTELPTSVSEMVNLTALILQGCKKLAYVPPLGNLKQLRELTLSDSGIKHMPEGLKELVNLESLEMDGTNLGKEILSDMSPKCPKLSTLLFHDGKIKTIPNSFFRHMGGLKLLNLKGCEYLTELPNCISEMVNLIALILQGCENLAYVPPLGNLKQLRELNLSHSGIKHIPEGLKELVHLESLDMSWTNLKEKIIPKGTLSKLHRLKQLIFPVEVQVCDPEVLNQLEAFHGYLSFADICEPFIISHWPTYYRLLFVGCFSAGWNNFRPYPNIHEHVLDKSLVFHGCDFQRGLDVASLPKDIEGLELRKCVVDQSDVFQILNSSNDLLDLRIKSLEGVEFLLKLSSPPPPPGELKAIPYGPLQKLETLDLMFLPDLVGFFDNQLLLPPGTFSSLEDVDIHGCDKMTKLFTVQLLQSLKNLKKLDVSDCKEVEEIAANEEEQAGGNGGGGILPSSSGTTNTLTLSQLFYLSLIGLPRLKNICKAAMTCNSIQYIYIIDCPNVKRLPLFFPIESGQLSPPNSLRKIYGQKEWWESLEWDIPNAMITLHPFFTTHWRYRKMMPA